MSEGFGAELDCASAIGSAAKNNTTTAKSGVIGIFMNCPHPM
jgi:hypothetical protein